MAIQRQSITRGPAIVQIGGQSIYTQGNIRAEIVNETFPINSSIYGKSTERLSDVTIRITFTPVGQWTTNLLAQLYPHTNPVIGGSLFGSSDNPVIIHPTNGTERFTFAAGAVTRMPNLRLSAVATSFTEMEITCLLKNNTDRDNAAALFALSDATFTDTSFSLANIMTNPYTVSLSSLSAPWNSIQTEAGVEVDFNLALTPVTIDSLGMVDMTISGLDIVARLKPLGMTSAQVMAQLRVQGTGTARGGDISASANNMTITGGSTKPQVVLNNVRLKSAPQIYSQTDLRHDTTTSSSSRSGGGGGSSWHNTSLTTWAVTSIGSGNTPPAQDHPNYVSGAGVGGANANGGPGLIVLMWETP